ncbi:IS3 family transposase [Paenibacillus contaminans]|uniref:IS3 family transposase n=1 Tax=Paenibacillus contaminans TaxID=450362 RepID=A0A329MUP5_9BACL|nr:IS3 family transposase [Paenibacillus contaminans]RAV22403.1 IS3 family transposase [Paenibacillus contaminans]
MGTAKGEKPKLEYNYITIEQLAGKYPISMLCAIANVCRSSYYKWLSNKQNPSAKKLDDEALKQKIMECHSRLKGIYGYLRVRVWLQRTYGLNVNHKRVYRLMKVLGIRSTIRRKKPYFGSKEAIVKSDNVLNREFNASNPNQKWVTDITFLPYNQKNLYLSAVLDIYNNEIIAYRIGKRNDLDLVLETVQKATYKRKAKKTLLHSDQGFQYTHKAYNRLLKQKKMVVSMSRKGNCWDNACIESFFGHFKAECFHLYTFESEEQLIQAIEQYIHFYNNERFQKKLNNLSPVEFRTKAA